MSYYLNYIVPFGDCSIDQIFCWLCIFIVCHLVTLTFDLRIHKCIQLKYKLLSINWPNIRKIRWKMAEKSQNADSGKEIKNNNKNKEKTIQQQKGLPTLSADLNERAMAGNSNHKYQFNSKITRLQCMKDGYQMRTGLEAEGGCLRVRTWFFFFFFFFLFDFNKAKGFYVWVCVIVLFPRIEPVGKPYREVCLQTEWWPWKVHQPNSWSKRPGTWIGHVLAYCRVGRKYVGCIELLFKLYRAIWRL